MDSNEFNINTSAPNLMCACIDGHRNSDIYGRLYRKGHKEPVLFENSGHMLLEMEEWCDEIGFPQPEMLTRHFKASGLIPEDSKSRDQKAEGTDLMSEEIFNNNGEEGTFIVHIKYRQNATWQGQVTWTEKKETQNFRSALELLKLIDCALDTMEGTDGLPAGKKQK